MLALCSKANLYAVKSVPSGHCRTGSRREMHDIFTARSADFATVKYSCLKYVCHDRKLVVRFVTWKIMTDGHLVTCVVTGLRLTLRSKYLDCSPYFAIANTGLRA
eukprot:355935-Chlamydomonas_euryale.AAC.6